MKRYAVIDKAAKMPATCKGHYRRLGIVELEDGYDAEDVTMLSERAKAVRSVVKTWEALHVGKTPQSAFFRALDEAYEELAALEASNA